MAKKILAKLSLKHPYLEAGKWKYTIQVSQVRVMAISEGYAMVRSKGAMPFCVREKDIEVIK